MRGLLQGTVVDQLRYFEYLEEVLQGGSIPIAYDLFVSDDVDLVAEQSHQGCHQSYDQRFPLTGLDLEQTLTFHLAIFRISIKVSRERAVTESELVE